MNRVWGLKLIYWTGDLLGPRELLCPKLNCILPGLEGHGANLPICHQTATLAFWKLSTLTEK
jgi:hypothetical protein